MKENLVNPRGCILHLFKNNCLDVFCIRNNIIGSWWPSCLIHFEWKHLDQSDTCMLLHRTSCSLDNDNPSPICQVLLFSIDACATQGHICQFVNDANRNKANCMMKRQEVNNVPRLCLFALQDLKRGEELQYDYGDNSKNLWWRRKVRVY